MVQELESLILNLTDFRFVVRHEQFEARHEPGFDVGLSRTEDLKPPAYDLSSPLEFDHRRRLQIWMETLMLFFRASLAFPSAYLLVS